MPPCPSTRSIRYFPARTSPSATGALTSAPRPGSSGSTSRALLSATTSADDNRSRRKSAADVRSQPELESVNQEASHEVPEGAPARVALAHRGQHRVDVEPL